MKTKITNVQLCFTPKRSSGQTQQQLFYLSWEDSFKWQLKQNTGLTNGSAKSGNFSLWKKYSSEDDRGNYTCSITFKNGETLSQTKQVQVLKIIAFSGVKLVSGQKLHLSCTIGDQLPADLEVKWVSPKKRPNFKTNPPSSANLTIERVGTDDGGKWSCELWENNSKTRLVSAEITVNIEPLLSAWMLVIICSAGVILILLLVLPFIIYRHHQNNFQVFGH
ncbi:CD4-1 molecule [Xenentodon cancila]